MYLGSHKRFISHLLNVFHSFGEQQERRVYVVWHNNSSVIRLQRERHRENPSKLDQPAKCKIKWTARATIISFREADASAHQSQAKQERVLALKQRGSLSRKSAPVLWRWQLTPTWSKTSSCSCCSEFHENKWFFTFTSTSGFVFLPELMFSFFLRKRWSDWVVLSPRLNPVVSGAVASYKSWLYLTFG